MSSSLNRAVLAASLGLCSAGLAPAVHATAFSFEPYVMIDIPGTPDAVAVGDVNGDGRDDIVATAVQVNRHITLVYLQAADGTLGPPSEYPFGGPALELEDVNADGVNDILLAPPFSGTIAILLADGAGGFTHVPGPSDSYRECADFAALDIDLDGVPDIVCHGSYGGSSVIYYGDGEGGTAATAELPTISTVQGGGYDLADIQAADVTGDGIEDLVLATYHRPGFLLFPHDGVGGFEPARAHMDPGYTDFRLTGMPFALEIADLDSDGRNDVALTKYYRPSHVTVFHQDAAGGMLDPVRHAGPDAMASMATADLDRDGSLDLLGANSEGMSWWIQSGGSLVEGGLEAAPILERSTSSLAAGDVNGDGCVDAVGTGEQLLLMVGRCGAASDFNGDGRSDVLWRNPSTGASALWNGAEYSDQLPIKGVSNLAWQVAGTGDVDGDGRADVVWREGSTGQNVAWLGGQHAEQQSISRVRDLQWTIAGIGDFDGDGVDDLMWRHAADGANVVWHAADSGRQQQLKAVTNTEWTVAGVADFDGDGADDLLWRNPVTGANTIWRSGNGDDQDNITDIRDTTWFIAGVGDFDADGRADILWRNSGNGRNVIWRGGQYGDQAPVRRVGDTDWTVAAIGDYDGDGRDDILWRHAASGRNVYWAAAQSTDQRRVRGVTNMDWQVVP